MIIFRLLPFFSFIFFFQCLSLFHPKEDSYDVVFDKFFNHFRYRYAYAANLPRIDRKAITVEEIYQDFQEKAKSAGDDKAFMEVLAQLKYRLFDPSIEFDFPDSHVSNFANPYSDDLFRKDVKGKELAAYKVMTDEEMKTKINDKNALTANESIGYIAKEYLSTDKIDDVLKNMPQTVGSLIIDLRGNQDSPMSSLKDVTDVAGRFFSAEVKFGEQEDRLGIFNFEVETTDLKVAMKGTSSEKFRSMNMVVLVNYTTKKFDELFLMAMKKRKKLIVIGGSATFGFFSKQATNMLANGWKYSYPVSKYFFIDEGGAKVNYFRVGIAPKLNTGDLYTEGNTQDEDFESAVSSINSNFLFE